MNGIFTDLLRSRVAFGWCRKTPGILWTQSSQRQRWPSTRGRLQLHTAASFAAATGGAAGARTSHDSSSKRAFMSTATFSLSFDTRFRPVVGSTRSEKRGVRCAAHAQRGAHLWYAALGCVCSRFPALLVHAAPLPPLRCRTCRGGCGGRVMCCIPPCTGRWLNAHP